MLNKNFVRKTAGTVRHLCNVGFLILLVLLFSLFMYGCSIRSEIYTPGDYEGVSEGYHGPIRVIVTTDAYQITKVIIVEEHEKLVLGEVVDIVYETIPERVIKQNSTEVNVVSGATFTSTALLEAIQDGIEKAGLNVETDTGSKTD